MEQPPETENQEISPMEFFAFVTQSQNIAKELSDAHLAEIADISLREYTLDKDSMSDWFDRMKRGVDLAQLIKDDKEYPFKGAANIKYPLITSAALQFNARAYPAIVPSDAVVRAKTHGQDPQGMKAARGERVSSYMSWQLTSEIEEWEAETDKLLVQLPIVGTMVRKVWFDPVKGRACCRVIDAGRFIINDKVGSLEDAPRATEELPLYPDEIETRVRSGQFIKVDLEIDEADKDKAQQFIEQHRRLDLDEDGYPEPYIVTIHKPSEKVVRIVADFEMQDVRAGEQGVVSIQRGSYFVPYHFLPGLDGGFWGTGLGLLLGDISDSVNSIINMLLDAGHYASLGGGFIGQELRMKGGAQRMRPGEWKMVSAGGGKIREALVPMTLPGPDGTLFQMLGMLIEAGREIASVKDIMTGDSGTKNMTATTTIALIEQGMMVFTAAYKRIFRSLKKEYKLLSKINSETVSLEKYSAFHDQVDQQGRPVMVDPQRDFGAMDMDIQPVADPRSVTKMQEAAKAELLMQMSSQGLVDKGEASSRIIDAMEIGDTESLVPQPDPMQQMMGQMQVQMMQADLAQKSADIELTLAKVQEARASVMESIAKAETDAQKLILEQKRLRMDGLMKLLEDERGRLEQAVKAGLGTMAGVSRDQDAPRGLTVLDGGGAGASAASLLGGGAVAGI